jgi:DNA-directed RNA polymerase sigma subunit (sigma70/sigma32)
MDRCWVSVDADLGDGRNVDCTCRSDVPLTARFDPAYLDSLLARITPFEAWVIRERHGLYYGGNAPCLSADDVGADCGLPAWRILEIEFKAIQKMTAMLTTLAAD